MEIGGVSSSYGIIKPQKPAEPQAPPGGNIENRQPPPEPQPAAAPTAAQSSSRTTGTLADIKV